jgi:hypothetical protein
VPQAFCLPARLVQPPDGSVQPRPLGDDARQLLVVLAARGAGAAGEDARVGSEEVAVQDVVAPLSQPAVLLSDKFRAGTLRVFERVCKIVLLEKRIYL